MSPSGRSADSLSTSVRQRAFEYLSGSTIRGLPRIIKAKTWASRLAWGVVVAVFTIVGLWQTHDVLRNFLSYRASVQERHVKDSSSPFPSVTLCNLQPLNSAPQTRAVMERYQAKWLRMRREAGADVAAMIAPLLSMNGFFQNAPRAVIRNASHAPFSLLRECEMEVQAVGQPVAVRSCLHADAVTHFPHAAYFNCYTVHPPAGPFVRRLRLTLYLDDFDYPILHDDFDGGGMQHGVRLVVHAPSSFPDIDNNGLELAPGSFTRLRLATRELEEMEAPYGNCSHAVDGEWIHAGDPDRGPRPLKYVYSAATCNRLRQQRCMVAHCACLDPNLPLPRNYSVDDSEVDMEMIRRKRAAASFVILPFCLKWKDKPDQMAALSAFYNRWRCWSRFTGLEDNLKQTSDACPEACLRKEYRVFDAVSSSRWPHEGFYRVVYDKYIRDDAQIRRKFDGLKRILDAIDRNHSVAYELLQNYRLVQRNFLRVELFRADASVTKLQAIKVFPFSQLIGSMGGTLNLWAGITMIAFVEFAELGVLLIALMCERLGRSDKEDNSEETEHLLEADLKPKSPLGK